MADDAGAPIYIVIAGGIVLDAYWNQEHAIMHRRSVTGAAVVPCELRSTLPQSVRDDIYQEWEAFDDDDTPIEDPHPVDTGRKGR